MTHSQNSSKIWQPFGTFSAVILLLIASEALAETNTQKISVKLFGQPCLLEGPLPKKQLANIHVISPAQIPLFRNLQQAQKSLSAIQKANPLPKEIKEYQESLKKNVLAHVDLFSELVGKNEVKVILEKLKTHFTHSSHSEFEMRLKLYLKQKKKETLNRLLESYQALVPERPEEAFHQAIEKMGVRYNCSFDAS